jgi:hypothetical protein
MQQETKGLRWNRRFCFGMHQILEKYNGSSMQNIAFVSEIYIYFRLAYRVLLKHYFNIKQIEFV